MLFSEFYKNRIIWASCILVTTVAVVFPEHLGTLIVVLVPSLLASAIFRYYSKEKAFITKVFLGALAVRLAFGLFIHVFELRGFFGVDATGFDVRGARLVDIWTGNAPRTGWLSETSLSTTGPGWGIKYLVGFLYLIFGKNILVAQSFCAVIGAATAPATYFCAQKIFHNRNVSRYSALAAAFFPAMVIWSSQLMKDGLIVFLLVLSITMVLHLQERLDWKALAVLLMSLMGILMLRFYIFYMVVLAVLGSFVIGLSTSIASIVRRSAALVALGAGFLYFGVGTQATQDIDHYARLETIQASRSDLAQSAESGFGEDIDVSTTEGAIAVLPIGFAYLMFAPFPWEMGNFRQAITLPEILIWWMMIPLIFIGIKYTVKNRLRRALPILIFTVILTMAYSIFQGNVGTAYRQRTQIQIFLFVFGAVGWVLHKENKENRQMVERNERQQRMAARATSVYETR